MRKKLLLGTLVVSVIGVFISCEDYKNCNSPVQTSLGIGFYQLINDEQADSILPALTMFGIGREDSLLALDMPLNHIYVPLKQNGDSTAFYIQPDSTLQNGDTVSVAYKREMKFISAGCGFATYYTLDTVYYTRHHIDSVSLSQQNITTANAINLQVYY